MIRRLILVMALVVSSMNSLAEEFNYEADVNGMVCAFCAYSVSKNISALPGVDADSVDVNLKDGHVIFHSSQAVHEDKLAALFTSSGFTISNMRQTGLVEATNKSENTSPVLTLDVKRTKVAQYASVLKAIGNIAASTSSHLLIKAPEAYEDKLLKPILMGRQQVIKVRFVPEESATIRILLFADSTH